MNWKDLFHKKAARTEIYDRETLVPVIRASICTGEKVAGFQEKAGGHFREVMLIRSDADLEEFRRRYGIEEEIRTVY